MSSQVSAPRPLSLGLGIDHEPHQRPDEADLSPDLQGGDGVEDQDDAQAVLQPAISAAASHYTSSQTPAAEKAAAMAQGPGSGYFDSLPEEDDDDRDEEEDGAKTKMPSSPRHVRGASLGAPGTTAFPSMPSPPAKSPMYLGWLPSPQDVRKVAAMPSPWHTGPKELQVSKDGRTRTRPSRSVLESAFSSTRARSRSGSQEALRRLKEALPSFGGSTHLLPSFSSSFSFFGDKSTSPGASPSHGTPTRNSPPRSRPGVPRRSSSIRSPTEASAHRPPILRRVTSDESILYHSLSRASSLGHDDQFQDVREMVNMRLMALKDSLPNTPNFKIPSLPKMPSMPSRMSFLSANAVHANPEQYGTHASPVLDREPVSPAKDPSAALDHVLSELTGDLVILGGLRGSVLRSAEPPHQQLWAPVKLGLNMRKVNLEVGLDDEDEERAEDTIIPSGMLSHIGPIDISRKLIKKIRSCENARTGKLRLHDYGYDWRLSPHLSSRKLREFLQTLPCNRAGVPPEKRGALVICHSLGGLITRHAVNQQPDLFSGVLYAGVPQRCINILGPLRNGDVVLLNEKLLTAQVNFSLRTSFAFLPEDGFCFINKETQEEYPVDFYDAQEWVKWRLSPCVNPPLPPFNPPKENQSAFSSLLPTALRARSDSNKDRTLAPQLNSHGESQGGAATATAAAASREVPTGPEHLRNMEYLTRTLAATKKFRSELHHRQDHHKSNAYPPLAVLYGKSIPTVYAAQVTSREAIPHSDVYDDLLFRAGDGVVLAKEAMLPEGYNIVRGGRVNTERGHITMLGDMPAVAHALEALVRGRKKGIGMGKGLGISKA